MSEVPTAEGAAVESPKEGDDEHYYHTGKSPRDLLLDILVGTARRGLLSAGVTLYVRGLVICGTLIGPVEWHREQAEQMRSFGEGAADFAQHLDTIADRIESDLRSGTSDAEAEGSGSHELPPVGFVYLKDAHVYVGGVAIPNDKNLLWRGRIDCVDGFSMGEFGPL